MSYTLTIELIKDSTALDPSKEHICDSRRETLKAKIRDCIKRYGVACITQKECVGSINQIIEAAKVQMRQYEAHYGNCLRVTIVNSDNVTMFKQESDYEDV